MQDNNIAKSLRLMTRAVGCAGLLFALYLVYFFGDSEVHFAGMLAVGGVALVSMILLILSFKRA